MIQTLLLLYISVQLWQINKKQSTVAQPAATTAAASASGNGNGNDSVSERQQFKDTIAWLKQQKLNDLPPTPREPPAVTFKFAGKGTELISSTFAVPPGGKGM